MTTVTLALHAMATRFELVLHGDEPARLRAAGEEAFAEIQRLEGQLSLFRPGSEIAQLNARAAGQAVPISPEVFALLLHARQLNQETGGAFDITIAPLMRCWGFRDGNGRVPSTAELEEARACVGMHLVEFNTTDFTILFARDGVQLDLGAIGKGYAIERGVELLREAGITSALLHGGTSTVYGLGHPPEADAWTIGIEGPLWESDTSAEQAQAHTAGIQLALPAQAAAVLKPFATVCLRDEALSVSAIWGRFFEKEGRRYGHIIDPRTGQPAVGGVLAAVAWPSATETDALSTALLTLGPEGHAQIAQLRPGMRTLVVGDSTEGRRIESAGIVADRARN